MSIHNSQLPTPNSQFSILNKLPTSNPQVRGRCPRHVVRGMDIQTLLSIAMLGGFIWAVRFLLPRAINERDTLALTAALLTAALALLAWLLFGVGVRSTAWPVSP